MKDKNLEKTIRNLQKIIEKRKGTDQMDEAIADLEEARRNAELSEKEDELEVPLSILISTYCGISNGPWWALGGLAVGKAIEELANRNETFYNLVNGLLELIHKTNIDSKKEKI